jgi:hypothetical protein
MRHALWAGRRWPRGHNWLIEDPARQPVSCPRVRDYLQSLAALAATEEATGPFRAPWAPPDAPAWAARKRILKLGIDMGMGGIPADDAATLAARGAQALSEYQLTSRPEALDLAVTDFQDAVAATPLGTPTWPDTGQTWGSLCASGSTAPGTLPTWRPRSTPAGGPWTPLRPGI